ncbi:hypothetical protein JNB62_13190 [Microbacterium jejuense]|uniref:Uncharacterized protein n=1 Tax=Microbacterium jejuense TaxID=1263637 RepID=A0ABS7HQH4_9MICO|nr:hypothetical protein [Microbacterium jejuense]MBW9094645.1 hypothetical protein [Microbacterium jejuense]
MPVTLTAVLLSAADPQPVQIALNGAPAGAAFTVVGTAPDGSRWPVPGGEGVSGGSQILLVDNRSALNTPITYSALVAGVTYTAAPVTVTSTDVAVIQTVDGLTVVGVEVASVTEPRKRTIRSSTFEIAGRTDPAARLDVPGSAEYSWVLETQGADSAVLEEILDSGRPIVRRLSPGMRDLKSVVLGVVLDWSDELLTTGGDTWRRWNLTVREISDPQPSTPLAAFTWEDFDVAVADRVWSWHTLFASLAGWAATNGTLSLVTSGGYSTPNYARASATAAATAVDIFESAFTAAAASLGGPVAPGDVITLTCRVKGTAGRSASAGIKWSGGTVVTGAAATLTGAWQMVSVTATAPAGMTGLALGARMAATGVVAGNLLEYSAPTISRGATVPNGTFDELFDTWDEFDAADWTLI